MNLDHPLPNFASITSIMAESGGINEILNNPTFRRFIWILQTVFVAFGGLLIFISFMFSWLPLKIGLLFIGSLLVLSLPVGIAIKASGLKVSIPMRRQVIIGLAIWVVILIYVFPHNALRWIIGGGIAFGFILLSTISRLFSLLIESMVPKMYYRDFKSGKNINAWGATGVAVMEPGIATLYGKRILLNFLTARMKSIGSHPFYFVNLLSFRKHDEKYALYAVKRSPAMIVVVRSGNKMTDEFREMLDSYIQFSTGKIFLVQISTHHSEPYLIEGRGIQNFEFVESTREQEEENISAIVTELTNQLTTNIIPIGDSDDALDQDSRSVIQLIARQGFPPVADCYLRFRLSQSNVERFIALLDCMEALVKVAVMYLSITQWSVPDHDPSLDFFKRPPTLGDWVNRLKMLNGVAKDDKISRAIKSLLGHAPHDSFHKLIEDASAQGLEWHETPPITFAEWFDWFVRIRNITRGHGAVTEAQVSPLWDRFHRVFLFMVLNFKPLLTDCTIVKGKKDPESSRMKGWTRIPLQSKGGEALKSKSEQLCMVVENTPDDLALSAYPFMIMKEGEILFLNSVQSNSLEYINLSSGVLRREENVPTTNLCTLWSKSSPEESRAT